MAEATEKSPMDYNEHNRTYAGFLHVAAIGTVWVLCIVAGLAIGGTSHRWGLAGFWIIVGTLTSALGLFIRGLEWRATLAVLVVMLATLALVNQ
jgi:hypothetical protein